MPAWSLPLASTAAYPPSTVLVRSAEARRAADDLAVAVGRYANGDGDLHGMLSARDRYLATR